MSANKLRKVDPGDQQWIIERSALVCRYKLAGRWVAGLLLLFCVSIVIFSLLAKSGNAQRYAVEQSLEGPAAKDKALYRDVDLLKRHSHALITGSIENKIRRIEADLRRGTVQAADLETLESVKEDLKLLKNYAAVGTSQQVAARSLPAAPQGPKNPAHLANQEQVLAEIATMKSLLYISLASCGLLFIGVGGLWLSSSASLRRLDSRIAGARVLLERPSPSDRS
jgi:hypothetical protein